MRPHTSLPRGLKAQDGRIEGAKIVLNAGEAEVRAVDGTSVPTGTAFVVQRGTPVDERVPAVLEKTYAVRR